ncbi:unnamed protein product [Rhodiola kirilowii]
MSHLIYKPPEKELTPPPSSPTPSVQELGEIIEEKETTPPSFISDDLIRTSTSVRSTVRKEAVEIMRIKIRRRHLHRVIGTTIVISMLVVVLVHQHTARGKAGRRRIKD